MLATAMHFSGLLVLHGSAVQTRNGVVAFLGLKGSGKSTLALALVAAGARLATDDTLPIAIGPDMPTVWPGVHSLRIRPDMLERPDLRGTPVLDAGRDGKYATAPLDASRVMMDPGPLLALYMLQPAVSAAPSRVVESGALDALRGTASLAAFAKAGRMLGRGEAMTILDRAGEVAKRVPVETLLVHRDIDRLSEVANEILSWHGGPVESPGTP